MENETRLQTRQNLLHCKNVTVMRGNMKALNRLSLSIEVGENVAILGPNGCGKSTLLQLITKEVRPLLQRGTQRIRCTMDVLGQQNWNVKDLRAHFGIINNEAISRFPLHTTVLEAVIGSFFDAYGVWPNHVIKPYMRAKSREILEKLHIAHLAKREIFTLSAGQIRRVSIARALVHSPHTLILDEPATALDFSSQIQLRLLLQNLAMNGVGIVVVTHHVEDVIPAITRVIMLKNGTCLFDGPKEPLLTEKNLETLFGVPITLECIRERYFAKTFA